MRLHKKPTNIKKSIKKQPSLTPEQKKRMKKIEEDYYKKHGKRMPTEIKERAEVLIRKGKGTF